mmetsp:Transcript_96122/g.173422  ORF Transcript_96122/g.173422 Transcript_96122/m.173422 type:complete len:168 (+) Transcript_96122:2-505(+)
MREASTVAPIDLGEDVQGEALHSVLHFLHTDQFEPVTPPSRVFELRDDEVLALAKSTLEVHMLADRFILPRLARLCEVFLSDYALRTSIVLPMLASITSPRRNSLMNLEASCWEFLEENWKEVKEDYSSTLQELIDQKHPLALELLQASRGVKRGARRLEDDTPPAA